ncbi:MAG: GAF domain-containing protein [Pseudomonadota bacterium]
MRETTIGAIQSPLQADLDRIAEDVLNALGVDISMLSVSDNRTLVTLGLSPSVIRLRENFSYPAGDMVCGQVAQHNMPLMLEDARDHPVVGQMTFVRNGVFKGYLGAPIHHAEFGAIGAVCAATEGTRVWTEENLKYLQAVAESVENILLREMYRLESADAASLASEYDQIIAAFALVRAEATSIHDGTGRLVFANRALTDTVEESELESARFKSVLLSQSNDAPKEFVTRLGQHYRLSPRRTSSGYLVCQWTPDALRFN